MFALKNSVVSLFFICLVVSILLFPYPMLSTKEPVWAIVVGFKGYAMYSFFDGKNLYTCGYNYRYVNDKYEPLPFIAKYDIVEEKLEWYKVIENVRGWACSVLLKNGKVIVAGFSAPGNGFLICLSENGDFLWGYMTPDCLFGLLDLGDEILAYGSGQVILFKENGKIVKSLFFEVKNSLGEWVPVDFKSIEYVDGKFYAVGYQFSLVSTKKWSFDGHLVCLGKDLNPLWITGFGIENVGDHYMAISYYNDYLYVGGFDEKGNMVLMKLNTNGNPVLAKYINYGGKGSIVAIHVIDNNIYVVGNMGKQKADSSDIMVLKVNEELRALKTYTIGGSLGDFCFKSTGTANGIIVSGKTYTWSLNKSSTESYPVIVYWPLEFVGKIGWKNVNWEPVVVGEGYELKTVLLSNITVLKLQIRHTNIKYDKHEFKLVEQNPITVLAKTETIPTTITPSPTPKNTTTLPNATIVLLMLAGAIAYFTIKYKLKKEAHARA